MPPEFVVALIWYVVFVYSTVCHEAGHAWAAYRLGDDTAYRGGQVSLDPVPHIRREPMGMIVVPIISFFMMGWMIGWASAPYDPQWAQRHPRRAAWMALAGPAANLIFVIIAAIGIRVGLNAGWFQIPDQISISQLVESSGSRGAELGAMVLSIVFSLNLLLFTFNLLPVPPLDGASVPLLLLPQRAADKYQEFMWNPTFQLFGLIIAWNLFGAVFRPIRAFAMSLLYSGVF
jgi:Zn-dependent protease